MDNKRFSLCCMKILKQPLKSHVCENYYHKCRICNLPQLSASEYVTKWTAEYFCTSKKILDLAEPEICMCGARTRSSNCMKNHRKFCGLKEQLPCCGITITVAAPQNASPMAIENALKRRKEGHQCHSMVTRCCFQRIPLRGEKHHFCPFKTMKKFTPKIYRTCFLDSGNFFPL